MAQPVYFSSLQQIKDNSLIDSNVQDKTLLIIQRTSENVWIQELLGTNLYKLLKNNILNNLLLTKQRILIEQYILPYEFALIEMLALDDILIKISDQVYTSTPPNTIQRTKDELVAQKGHKARAVNFYAGLLKQYIQDNIADFPTYQTNTEGVPAKINQTFGFYCDDNDFIDDANYNQRQATNQADESI